MSAENEQNFSVALQVRNMSLLLPCLSQAPVIDSISIPDSPLHFGHLRLEESVELWQPKSKWDTVANWLGHWPYNAESTGPGLS